MKPLWPVRQKYLGAVRVGPDPVMHERVGQGAVSLGAALALFQSKQMVILVMSKWTIGHGNALSLRMAQPVAPFAMLGRQPDLCWLGQVQFGHVLWCHQGSKVLRAECCGIGCAVGDGQGDRSTGQGMAQGAHGLMFLSINDACVPNRAPGDPVHSDWPKPPLKYLNPCDLIRRFPDHKGLCRTAHQLNCTEIIRVLLQRQWNMAGARVGAGQDVHALINRMNT